MAPADISERVSRRIDTRSTATGGCRQINMTLINFTQGRAIKWLSVVLMALALGLEIARLSGHHALGLPQVLLTAARFALVIHLIEGAIAAVVAALYHRPAGYRFFWRYGLYTFWVGTVGLVELFRSLKAPAEPQKN